MPFSKAIGFSALLSLLLGLIRLASAAQWTIIQYEIIYVTASTDQFEPTLTFTETSTLTLEPPVMTTPTGKPTSIDTSYDSLEDIAYTTLYLPSSALPAKQFASLTASTVDLLSSTPITEWYIDNVYTAPASCKHPFTFTTSSLLFVPFGAGTNLSPTSATTTTSLDGDVVVTGFLSAGAVNITSTASSSDFVYSDYIASCTNPATFTNQGINGAYPTDYSYNPNLHSGGDDYYYYNGNCLGSLCPFWLIYIVVIIPVLALLFLGGLIESYYWFTRLMKGQSALRGVPLMWVAISLWTLCCLRRHRAANPEAQAQLLKQWRDMSSGQHIKLWLSYGFRHRDPPQLTAVIGAQSVVPVWQSYNQPPYNQQQPPYGGGPPPGGVMGPPPPPGSPPPMGYQQHPQQWQQGAPPPPGWTPQPGYSPYQNKSPYSPPPGPGSPPPQFQGYTYLPPQQQQMQQMQQMAPPGHQQPGEATRGSFVPSPATSPSTAPAEPVSARTPPPPSGPIHGATPELQQPVPIPPPMQHQQHVEAPGSAVGEAHPHPGVAQ